MATRAHAVSSRLTALSGSCRAGNVAVRQAHGRFERLVEHLDPVMLLENRRDAADHQNRLVLGRLLDLDDLEAPRQRGILLDVFLVLGPGGRGDRAQRAARQRRLEQVRRVAGAGGAAGADQRVRLVDEQDDRLGRRLDFVDHLAQAVLELAFHARAGLQQADVERVQRHVLQRRRHIASRQPQREAFDDRRLADAGLAGENRIVLTAAHQDVDDLPDLLVAAADRIDLALARLLGQVRRKALERFLLAHLRGRHRVAGLARRRQRRSVGGAERVLRRAVHDPREVLGQRVGLDVLELPGDAISALRSDGVFSMPMIRWPVRTRGSPNISVA